MREVCCEKAGTQGPKYCERCHRTLCLQHAQLLVPTDKADNRLECAPSCTPMGRVAAVLTAARQQLVGGWSEDSDSELGPSVLEALGNHGDIHEVLAAEEVLRLQVVPRYETTLAQWLEDPRRSHDDVLVALSKAAARAQRYAGR